MPHINLIGRLLFADSVSTTKLLYVDQYHNLIDSLLHQCDFFSRSWFASREVLPLRSSPAETTTQRSSK